MRLRPALLLLPVLVVLAGCTPAPEPTPTATSSDTATPSSSPAPTPTPTPAETSSPPAAGAFTKVQLVSLCTDKIRTISPNATFFADMATTEWLEQSAVWFVAVPETIGGQDNVAVCGIGGSPDAPDFVMHGETLPDGVAGIRDDLLAGNAGGDD
ncbi:MULTISPECIES: hypothetical protein [Microbacterium]|uniref:hypothetical protein n=1 Tax=Microbacterium TaxID=33882 RepID=UPI002285E0B3|nr:MULTISPECIES: hypothetical protein [Microbacterium]MCZ0709458.1 hypothetical protein [Microbacterium paraoxydans]